MYYLKGSLIRLLNILAVCFDIKQGLICVRVLHNAARPPAHTLGDRFFIDWKKQLKKNCFKGHCPVN